MTFYNVPAALVGTGFNPDTTPVDTLMGAPLNTHLHVAEAMEDDGDYLDHEGIPEGFQETGFDERLGEIIDNDDYLTDDELLVSAAMELSHA